MGGSWPGDHDNKVVSLLTYGAKVGVAIVAGKTLADGWLALRQAHQRVIIVAHSLGSRVALEAMLALRLDDERGAARVPPRRYAGATVEAVFLMAAAVPVHLCTPHSAYLDLPWRACAEHVLHSRNDSTLRDAFGPGEWTANEHGPAVGLDGDPLGRWSSQLPPTGLGHSEYWDSKDVARTICVLAGLLQEHAVASQTPAEQAPEERIVERQDLPAQNVATR